MTEKKFLQEVMKKNMPDKEQIRRNCLRKEPQRDTEISWRRRLATAAVCVVAAVFAGTGVCYAATGENPINLFRVLFDNSDPVAVAQMEEGFVESDTVFEFDNLQLTFERYFFDEEQGIILAEMTLESKDGSPIVSWEDAYGDALDVWDVSEVASNAEQWKEICREDEKQYQIYKETCEELFSANTDLVLCWPLEDNVGYGSFEMEDEGTYHFYQLIVEQMANEYQGGRGFFVGNSNMDQTAINPKQDSVLAVVYQNELVGEAPMENSGTIRSRSADKSKLENCTEIEITGAYLQIRFERDAFADADYRIPFEQIEITLNDGSIYRWQDESWLFDQESGTERILTEEEEKALEDEPGVIRIYCTDSFYDEQGNNITAFCFPEFINVDDIVSVTIDGMECLK